MKPPYAICRIDDDWLCATSNDGSLLRVRVHLTPDGRYSISEVTVAAPKVTAALWRSISISRLEAAINTALWVPTG